MGFGSDAGRRQGDPGPGVVGGASSSDADGLRASPDPLDSSAFEAESKQVMARARGGSRQAISPSGFQDRFGRESGVTMPVYLLVSRPKDSGMIQTHRGRALVLDKVPNLVDRILNSKWAARDPRLQVFALRAADARHPLSGSVGARNRDARSSPTPPSPRPLVKTRWVPVPGAGPVLPRPRAVSEM